MIKIDTLSPASKEVLDKILKIEIKDEICFITIDMIEHSTNVLNNNLLLSLMTAIKENENNPSVKGYIVTSAKREFVSGADLKAISESLLTEESPDEILKKIYTGGVLLREIEKVTKPKVVILEGTALGGGFELASSMNHLIALNDPKIQIGLPEIQIGLFPGAGLSVKLPYIIGIQPAVEFILKSTSVKPADALNKKLIHQIADSKEQAIKLAKEFITNNPNVVMPWDDKKYRIPGGGLIPNNVPFMLGAAGNSIKNTHNKLPNVRNFLAVVAHSLQLPMDRAIEVEARFIANTAQSKEAKAMIRSIFINRQNATKGKYKPAGLENTAKREYKKVGVLGAGMMGAGIAYASATSGIDVVLKDVSLEAANKGKEYSKNLLAASVSKGKITQEKMDDTLSKIKTTDDYSDLKDCDLIIEAVFENSQLKSEVTKLTEAQISANTIFASNTSSIPITKLAESSIRDDKFIGIHFFSPVDKMMLVEVIPGENTSKETIATAIDYVSKIKKIPIVVKDSYSFYVNRVFAVLFEEVGKLVDEGVPVVLIENLWKNMGMPVGAFALADELYLPLIQKLCQTAIENGVIDKDNLPAWNVIVDKLVEIGRLGKKDGKGFYDYSSTPKKMWTGLKELFPEKDHGMSNELIQRRIFHRAAVETARCLEEGIVATPDECDLGSLFGMGFLPYAGGAAGYMDFIGLEQFIKECDELVVNYGNGFKMPDSFRTRKSIY